MAKLKIRSISRVTYDPENEAIRSYYDPAGVDGMKDVAMEAVAKKFLQDNLDDFKFELEQLVQIVVKNASGFQSVRYLQYFKKVPVYGALVVVNVGKDQGNVLSFYNNFDYSISDRFNTKPTKTEKDAYGIIENTLAKIFEKVDLKGCKLFIYRHRVLPGDIEVETGLEKRPDAKRIEVLKKIPTRTPKEGELVLAWRVIADVKAPLFTSLELLVDAKTGDIILVRDRGDYVSGTGKVFIPDPVTSSGNTSLCTSTPGSLAPTTTFDPERKDVTFLGLDPADSNGKYHLKGTYCCIKDDESPTHAPPSENTPDFNYSTNNRDFLAVMVYYWIDTVQRFIQNVLSVADAADYQIEVDPQGMSSVDNSHFVPGTTPGNGRLAFGEGGAPDASDAAVILHEYGHAIHEDQEFTGATDLKEGFADIFAHLFLDRFNPNQILRDHVMPFDNNPNCSYHWNANRRVNLSESYSDTNYSSYGAYFKGSIWATTVWQIYLALGGASVYQNKRNWAADLVLKLHLEANVGYSNITTGYTAAYANHQRLAEAFEMASYALNNWRSIPNGLFHKVIRDYFINRGLFDQLDVDVYIDDGRNGGYDYLEAFWNCQDLVVRRNSTDSPTMGHEQPIVNQPNYLWVKVKRKGTGNPGTVNVKAFSCSPGTGLSWPTHWTASSPASLSATTLATATEEWVGPFEFTPTEVNHACVFAIVEAANDSANTQNLVGNVPHWMLISFDNNIAQRNLSPVPGGGGKQVRGFRVINSTDHFASVSLDVIHDLPKGWQLDFDVPDIKNIPLAPYAERWVNLRVKILPEQEFLSTSERARVTIISLINGIPDGGMTFEFVHPSLYPPDVKPIEIPYCCECLRNMLESVDVEGEIKLEIRFKKRT